MHGADACEGRVRPVGQGIEPESKIVRSAVGVECGAVKVKVGEVRHVIEAECVLEAAAHQGTSERAHWHRQRVGPVALPNGVEGGFVALQSRERGRTQLAGQRRARLVADGQCEVGPRALGGGERQAISGERQATSGERDAIEWSDRHARRAE